MQISIANIIRGTLIGNTMSVLTRYISRVVNGGGIVESPQCVETALNSQGLLQQASLLVVPSGYKGGTLYSEIPTNGNGDLTWTRGSDAFRTNASGLIQRVPWNLLQYSEEFSNAYWGKTGSSINANSTNAPNSTLTADSLIEDSSTGLHFTTATVTVITNTTYTATIYVKANTRTKGRFRLNDTGGQPATDGNFDLNAETISAGTITNVGGGWYRLSLSRLMGSTSASLVVFLADSSGTISYTGNGTSGIFIWGAQLVEGTTAQTYLPTTDRLNFPRLSYMYGSCPAVLLEPQRTNLVLRSEEFDNASWTKPFGWTVTANATTSPDGTSNADLITPTNFNNVSQSCVVTTSTNYAISIYVKRNTTNSTWVSLIFSGGTSISYGYVINWSTLSISLIPVRTAATNPTFESVGNGWYRISFVCASGNNTFASLQIIPDSQAGTNSVYLYGAQLELGAYPTTYIPTTSATATRVADSFSRNNIFTNGLISASGGTWFVELRNNIGYTRDNGLNNIILSNSGIDTYIRLRNDGSANSTLLIQTAVSGIISTHAALGTPNVKFAIKWNGTTADVFVNGVKTVASISFVATQLEILSCIPQVPTFIQQMALYPTPLTDTQCQTLTTL